MQELGLPELEPTSGNLLAGPDDWLEVTEQICRGVARDGQPSSAARITFRFQDFLPDPERSNSGKTFFQIAIQLRALNACNLIYLCWRFDLDPTQGQEHILAQIKRNPLTSRSADCGGRSYVPKDIWRRSEHHFPSGSDGEEHTLEARIAPISSGYEFTSSVDGHARQSHLNSR